MACVPRDAVGNVGFVPVYQVSLHGWALFCLGSNVHLPFILEAPRGGSLLCLISGSQDQPDREGAQWEFGVWSLGSVEHQPGAGLRLSLAAGPLSPVCSLGPSLEQTFAQKETGPARPPWVPSTLSGGWLGAVAHTSSAHSKVRAIPSASPALLCLLVERDHALGHQEPHWKEFRFDLTQIPDGEAVTAAEFRIYKVPSIHLLNRTLHVSMFQVVQEQSNRCLPLGPGAPCPCPLHSLMVKATQQGVGVGGTLPRGPERDPQRRERFLVRAPCTVGRAPVTVLPSSPCPAILAMGT